MNTAKTESLSIIKRMSSSKMKSGKRGTQKSNLIHGMNFEHFSLNCVIGRTKLRKESPYQKVYLTLAAIARLKR